MSYVVALGQPTVGDEELAAVAEVCRSMRLREHGVQCEFGTYLTDPQVERVAETVCTAVSALS